MSAMAGPGTLVTPSIELVRRIGAGGMGTVWIGFHRGLKKQVAVKLMAESILSSPQLRARFAQEAVAGANVKSPHVVQVFDTGATEALGPYIVMELLEGEDLGSRLASEECLAPALVVRVVTQAAHALDRAHEKGIVHRDIKPANIFLCVEAGAPFLTKVLDFGVATLRLESTPITTTGISVGTPTYMSPEQAAGSSDLDGKSDLYSLALVAFRALTGSAPFPRSTMDALGLAVYHMPAPALTERRSSLPPAVDKWFARAIARDPKARFPDGATMATELARALGVEASAAEPIVEAVPETRSEGPRSDGPTNAHVPAPAATPLAVLAVEEPRTLATEAGLTQRTNAGTPPEPAPRRGLMLLAAAAILGGIGVIWSVQSARNHAADPAPSAQIAVPVVAPVIDAGAPPVSIGVLLDLSGERRQNGQKLLAATTAARDLVNRSGGVRGRPIRLVVVDDQGDTGKFLTDAARELLREKGLKVIIGPMTSPQVALVAPMTQAAGVLEIAGAATSPELTTLERANERLLFRTVPSQTFQSDALARVMRDAKCATTALVATDDVAGRPFVEVFSRSFTEKGGRVVTTQLIGVDDQASYAKQIRGVVDSRADCQVIVLAPKAAARYLRQALAPKTKIPAVFGASHLATDDFLDYARSNHRDEASRSLADDVRGVRPATNLHWRPEFIELEHLMSVPDGGENWSTSPYVASQFDATILAALTLEAAGPDADADKLRTTLRDISRGGHVYGPHEMAQLLAAIRRGERVDYAGASGDVDLDENGDVESDMVSWVVKNGEIVETGRVPPKASP